MVVGFNSIDDSRVDAITTAEFRADDRVRAFRVVIHGFTDIVQQTGSLGYFRIRADFHGQQTGNHGRFHGMGQLVLAVRGAEFQAAQHAQHIQRQPGHTRVEGGLFAGLLNHTLNFFLFFSQDFFNVRRMNTAVGDQAFQ